MASDETAPTEYVVLRADVAIQDSDLPRSLEGTWRRRSDMQDRDFIEVLGPAGNMRARPTRRTEVAPDGSVAQVYEIVTDAADLEGLRTENLALLGNGEPLPEPD